jgi:hypothetical protein
MATVDASPALWQILWEIRPSPAADDPSHEDIEKLEANEDYSLFDLSNCLLRLARRVTCFPEATI